MSWPRLPLPWVARDQATPRQAARPGGLPLRLRPRRRQAGPADQLLLPQPRRKELRRVPAPHGGDGLEELPEDLARGDRGGQDQVPLPLARRQRWPESCSAYPGGSPPTRQWSWFAWP